ncbi:transposable element Tcb1 transposase [Trichonephila clavipes]|uniref:Transposable element Tcb1 transposase n=1 Tax=Trichonephila clavipes TaxID=2585209 RepID=A0A8X7BIB0_TRICX|nr:transposable element Tcb1 transposase [Trichonephila clavipes]
MCSTSSNSHWTPQQSARVRFSDKSRFSLLNFHMESTRYPLPPIEHHLTTPFRWYRLILSRCHSGVACSFVSRLTFVFMDDNACLRRANIVNEYLKSEDISRMDWRSFSPGFNPLQHVWHILGRRIAARQPHPTFLQELRRA